MPTVGYVVLNFPKLSETFIVDELIGLERQGLRPLVYAREPLVEQITNPRSEALLPRVTRLSAIARRRQLVALGWTVIRHPVRLLGCIVVALGTRSRWSFVNLRYAIVLASRAKADGVGYLHAHFAGDAGELAYFAARLLGIPFGMTLHGVDIYLNRFLCRKLRAAALLVTVCDYNVRQLVERCPARVRSDYLVKFAGIDTTEFALVAPRPLRPGRRIVAVGRFTTKKGFDHLIQAVGLLVERGQAVECALIGEGGIEEDLRAITAGLGLADVVEFLGPLPPAGVRAELERADVLAAPCTVAPWGDRDSMPVVIKEAMAMELPVVATNDFGIPEMVDESVGVLVPRDDVAALADALQRVLSEPAETRAAMGRSGRDVVRSRLHEPDLVAPLARQFVRLTGG